MTLTLYNPAYPSSCSTNRDDAVTTLTHELGHVLGYQSGAHQTPPSYRSFRLPDDGTINGTVCQHEVEGVLSAYSFRPRPFEVDSFWTKPIVTGLVTTPSSVSVAVDATKQVTVTHFTFRRQNNAPAAQVGSASFSWAQGATNIATVSQAGLVTGKGEGTTKVTVSSPSPLPSTFQLGGRFAGWGQEIPVTVTTGGGGPGFRVSALNGVATPITTAGTHWLSAAVINAPVGTLMIRWVVAYSNAVIDTVDTGFGPNSYALQVPAGSYTIRVTATPRIGNETGASRSQDFPVCTGQGGGGGEFIAAKPPGGGTDAVEGC